MHFSLRVFLLIIAIKSIQIYGAINRHIVHTADGKIKGITLKDRKDENFYAFYKIPYAKPPINERRFKAPEQIDPWSGVLDGTKNSPICYQREYGLETGKENCLFVNVYTKQINVKDNEPLKPVMVFVHGGGYIEGSAKDYGGKFLMTEDIVLVIVNYRLGAFGFMSFKNQTAGVPGNAGLKDQVMALKWVQRNIKSFGGDPTQVTIFGESAGASSVHLHILSPMSKGLFNKAILQSGSALASWNYGVLGTGDLIAKELGIEDKDTNVVLDKMRKLSTHKIFEAQLKIIPAPLIHTRWEAAPVVEKQTNEPAFLPDDPIKIIESGNYNHVPFITGCTTAEGLYFEVIPRIITGSSVVERDLYKSVPYDLHIQNGSDLQAQVTEKIKDFYYAGKIPTNQSVQEFIKVLTDIWFIYPAYQAVKAHLRTSSSPIYYYTFSADTKLNFVKRMDNVTAQYPGVAHGDDLGYIFDTRFTEEVKRGSIEEKCLERVIKLWTNFAKYGDPTPDRNSIKNVNWHPVSQETFNYIDIGSNGLQAGENPNHETIQFWNSIYKNYKQK